VSMPFMLSTTPSGALRAIGSCLAGPSRARASYSTSGSSSINYPGHIPLSWAQNAVLAVGSGVVGVLDTSRGGTYIASSLMQRSAEV
jgi:hypothetical protein